MGQGGFPRNCKAGGKLQVARISKLEIKPLDLIAKSASEQVSVQKA